MKIKIGQLVKFVLIFLLIILVIGVINHFGLQRLRDNLAYLGFWGPLGLFILRFISVVFPILPGTAYSILAGGLFGFSTGLIIICLADLFSCSLSFYLSRKYGREMVEKLVGNRFMIRVNRLSQQHLENNFFLMSAFLMTGFFDFVCYGVGLTKTSLMCFFPALIISILISNPPIVALGAGLLEGGKLLLGFAILGMLGLGIITAIVKRRLQKQK